MRTWVKALLTVPAAVVVCTMNGSGQGSPYAPSPVINRFGVPVAGVTVTVCAAGSSGVPCAPPLANTIFSNAGLSTALANPFTTDGLGNYSFYALPGAYQVCLSGSGITATCTQTVLPCVAIMAASCGVASAVKPLASDAVQFVSINGNDSNDGFSWGTAKLSPQTAYNAIPSSGGIVQMGAGTFSTGGISITAGKPVRFELNSGTVIQANANNVILVTVSQQAAVANGTPFVWRGGQMSTGGFTGVTGFQITNNTQFYTLEDIYWQSGFNPGIDMVGVAGAQGGNLEAGRFHRLFMQVPVNGIRIRNNGSTFVGTGESAWDQVAINGVAAGGVGIDFGVTGQAVIGRQLWKNVIVWLTNDSTKAYHFSGTSTINNSVLELTVESDVTTPTNLQGLAIDANAVLTGGTILWSQTGTFANPTSGISVGAGAAYTLQFQNQTNIAGGALQYLNVVQSSAVSGTTFYQFGLDGSNNPIWEVPVTSIFKFHGGFGGSNIFAINPTSAPANRVEVFSGNAGANPSFQVFGTDTNAGLDLFPKGTGLVRVPSNGFQVGGGSAITSSGAGGTAASASGAIVSGNAAKWSGTAGALVDSGLALPAAAGNATVPQVIASGTATMTTAAIAAGNCGTTVTVAATNVLTTDTITWAFNAAPAGSNAGLVAWPTTNNVNFAYCPNSAETPAAATINWRVVR
jgi:hypothetical protein